MKNKLLFISLITCFNLSFSQQTNNKEKKDEITEVYLDLEEEKNEEDVSFETVDKPPLFPECLDSNNQKKCMKKMISKKVINNFNKKIIDSLNVPLGKQRIYIRYIITKTGTIKITDSRSSFKSKKLTDEAERAVKLLPKMKPAEHKGKKVNVPYLSAIVYKKD